MKPVCVVGAGAWGSAIATVLAYNKIPVYLWCYEEDVAREIMQSHTNSRYLPGISLSPLIQPVISFEHVLPVCEWIFQVTPVRFLAALIQQIKPYLKTEHKFIVLSKGIESSSCLFPMEFINEVVGEYKAQACLMGPSFAHEVAHRKLTGVVLACKEEMMQYQIAQLIENNYFKIVMSRDTQGVQIAAALKNIIALAYGIVLGAQFSQNTNALYITQLFQEVGHYIKLSHGDSDTMYGLAGLGDVVLTTFGTQSKNLAFGKMLGQGFSFLQAQETCKNIPEGINTAQALKKILSQDALRLPLLEATVNLILGEISAQSLLTYL